MVVNPLVDFPEQAPWLSFPQKGSFAPVPQDQLCTGLKTAAASYHPHAWKPQCRPPHLPIGAFPDPLAWHPWPLTIRLSRPGSLFSHGLHSSPLKLLSAL